MGNMERKVPEYFRFIVTVGDILYLDVFWFWREGGSGGVSSDGSEGIEKFPASLHLNKLCNKFFKKSDKIEHLAMKECDKSKDSR
jgi:hypothetical protein